MTDWEKQLENVDPEDISVILVSPKTFGMMQKASKPKRLIVHKTGFNAISFKGIPIAPSEMPKDDEFIILGKQVQWLIDLMAAPPLARPKLPKFGYQPLQMNRGSFTGKGVANRG